MIICKITSGIAITEKFLRNITIIQEGQKSVEINTENQGTLTIHCSPDASSQLIDALTKFMIEMDKPNVNET